MQEDSKDTLLRGKHNGHTAEAERWNMSAMLNLIVTLLSVIVLVWQEGKLRLIPGCRKNTGEPEYEPKSISIFSQSTLPQHRSMYNSGGRLNEAPQRCPYQSLTPVNSLHTSPEGLQRCDSGYEL